MSMTLTVNTSRYGSGFASAVQYSTTTIINETVKLKIPPQKGECALFLMTLRFSLGANMLQVEVQVKTTVQSNTVYIKQLLLRHHPPQGKEQTNRACAPRRYHEDASASHDKYEIASAKSYKTSGTIQDQYPCRHDPFKYDVCRSSHPRHRRRRPSRRHHCRTVNRSRHLHTPLTGDTSPIYVQGGGNDAMKRQRLPDMIDAQLRLHEDDVQGNEQDLHLRGSGGDFDLPRLDATVAARSLSLMAAAALTSSANRTSRWLC